MVFLNLDNKNYSIKYIFKNYSIKYIFNMFCVFVYSLFRYWYLCKYDIFCCVLWCNFLGIFILNY